MIIELKEKPDFLLKDKIKEIEIVWQNGVYVAKTTGFKQVLKKSEYEYFLALANENSAEKVEVPEAPKKPRVRKTQA